MDYRRVEVVFDEHDAQHDEVARNERDDAQAAREVRREDRVVARNQALIAYHDGNQRFLERVIVAQNRALTHKTRMDDFAEVRERVRHGNIFAHQAAGDGKSYLKGAYRSMFNFCHDVDLLADQKLSADEVIPSDEPIRVFFDLEIKQDDQCQDMGPVATNANVDEFMAIMSDHVKGSVAMARASGMKQYKPTEDHVKSLCQAYYSEAGKAFTEDICSAGLRIMLAHLNTSLKSLMGDDVVADDIPWDDLFVTSGCRGEKFSLHVVVGRIFFDRSFLSCPIIVFEIARFFVMSNLTWLLWDDDF
jgi:hypothetical protein